MNKTRNIFQCILLILCFIGIIFLIDTQNKIDKDNDVISNIKVHTKDESIEISWNVPSKTNITNTIIEIKDINENIVYSYTIKANEEFFVYKDGEINNCYLITLSTSYKDGSIREIETDKRLFLDLDSLPDLPTIYIDTKSGDDPVTEYAKGIHDLITTTNNEYEEASMNYIVFGNNINSKLKIKIRGNGSSTSDKKPYKIVLDNPIDLTNLGKDYSHKEWVLLNTGATLNNFLGETISTKSNVEWVTHGIYINLILNGDYKGIYTLTEAVSQNDSRGLVSEDGVIFENDVYFWNCNGIYFKLKNQRIDMGYTFKYPKMDSSQDERLIEVHEYMQEFVDLLVDNGENAWNYADLDNFTSYMIAKDLMADGDPRGSNIFYYVKNFYFDNKTKIKIGPLWDFEWLANPYATRKYSSNVYPTQHNIIYLPFVDNKEFIEAYWDKWEEVSVNILDDIYSSLDDLYSKQGEAINESRYLNSLRWSDGSYETIEDEMSLAKDWLYKQVEFLNNEMENRQ